MTGRERKESGAYFTPTRVASTLIRWAVRSGTDRLLDPACGDGRFIAEHRNSVGVERDRAAAGQAIQRAPGAVVHQRDFFAWAADTDERFDCAVGNPPFIRYQSFGGDVRRRALRLCAALGAELSGLASSWVPFLAVAASLLKPAGRMAFVAPAEIGHAPYAAPLLEYLVRHFEVVHVVAVREKLFPQLSEDCWLLYAEGFGGSTEEIRFTPRDRFQPSREPPQGGLRIPVSDWRDRWNRRLRPFLLSERLRSLYGDVAAREDSNRLGELATTRIGYVSGANDFFHFRPSEACAWRIPPEFLHPTVRNGKVLPARQLTRGTVDSWRRSDQPMLLLRIPRDANLPDSVLGYLNSVQGERARAAYKCRTREPWYSVPDVRVPDLFLTYMSGRRPSLVRNAAAATCSNAVHSVQLHDKAALDRLVEVWESPFVSLSCELEGHSLGGGMLKLELREAGRVVLPSPSVLAELALPEIDEAVATMRAWRHYAPDQ